MVLDRLALAGTFQVLYYPSIFQQIASPDRSGFVAHYGVPLCSTEIKPAIFHWLQPTEHAILQYTHI